MLFNFHLKLNFIHFNIITASLYYVWFLKTDWKLEAHQVSLFISK